MICRIDYTTSFPRKQQETSLILVDKRGFFDVKERLKVHQSIERTPKSTPLLFVKPEYVGALDNGLWVVCSDDLKNIRLINVSVQDVTVRVKGYCFDILRIFLIRRNRRGIIIKVFPKIFERVS